MGIRTAVRTGSSRISILKGLKIAYIFPTFIITTTFNFDLRIGSEIMKVGSTRGAEITWGFRTRLGGESSENTHQALSPQL